jgi:hypothetical protein
VIWIASGGRIFQPYGNIVDSQTGALYLLSTLTQGVAAVVGISIAVFFVTIQSNGKSGLARVLGELHAGRSISAYIAFFLTVLACDIFALSALSAIVSGAKWWLIDLVVLANIAVMFLLGPIVLLQIENVHPLILALKLSAKITPRRIWRYQLVRIDSAPAASGRRHVCSLNMRGQRHGLDDPLGAMHEVMLIAVNNRDRVLLSALTRILLRRIARCCGEAYPVSRQGEMRRVWRLWSRLYGLLGTRCDEKSRLAVTLHILHYVIRRTENLRKELGAQDMIRQQYLLNLHDLIEAVARRTDSNEVIELCLLAAFHIDMKYSDIGRYSTAADALNAYFALAMLLDSRGYHSQALLTMRILGFLATNTVHLDRQEVAEMLERSDRELQGAYGSIPQTDERGYVDFGIPDPWSRTLIPSVQKLPLASASQ